MHKQLLVSEFIIVIYRSNQISTFQAVFSLCLGYGPLPRCTEVR